MEIGSFVRMRWLWKLLFDSSPKLAEKASFPRKTSQQKVFLHPPQHRISSIRREILINSKKNIRNVSYQCQTNGKKVTRISHNDKRLQNLVLSLLISWSMNHSNDQNKSLCLFSVPLGIPDAPTNVRLMVTGSNNITVTYDEPHRSNGAMVIKYKSKRRPRPLPSRSLSSLSVEWCADENFDENPSSPSNVHSDIVKNCFLREYVIRELPIGEKCYVRVSAGNLRGFGPSAIANPPYCVPSSK